MLMYSTWETITIYARISFCQKDQRKKSVSLSHYFFLTTVSTDALIRSNYVWGIINVFTLRCTLVWVGSYVDSIFALMKNTQSSHIIDAFTGPIDSCLW